MSLQIRKKLCNRDILSQNYMRAMRPRDMGVIKCLSMRVMNKPKLEVDMNP